MISALPRNRPNRNLIGITYKVVATLLFTTMAGLIRALGDTIPVGQVIIFRSAFAFIPVLAVLLWQNRIDLSQRPRRVGGQVVRSLLGCGSMFFLFAGLQRLPIAEATAFAFVTPLMTVVLAAVVLREPVGALRWFAVTVGLGGVLLMLFPLVGSAGPAHPEAALGITLTLAGAFLAAGATIQIRRLSATESIGSIVLYFTCTCLLAGLLTLPFQSRWPSSSEALILVVVGLVGGLAQLFMTASYAHADASVVAPYDYTTMVWALVIGFFIFAEVPGPVVSIGAAVVAGAGLFLAVWERSGEKARLLAHSRKLINDHVAGDDLRGRLVRHRRECLRLPSGKGALRRNGVRQSAWTNRRNRLTGGDF